MLIRYTVLFKNKARIPIGVFQAAYDLKHNEKLTHEQKQRFKSIMKWFDDHLPQPESFSRSKSKAQHKEKKAIAWFKEEAKEHLMKIREVITILNEHEIEVREIQTDHPGYVVYEDQYQLIAEPFNDTLV